MALRPCFTNVPRFFWKARSEEMPRASRLRLPFATAAPQSKTSSGESLQAPSRAICRHPCSPRTLTLDATSFQQSQCSARAGFAGSSRDGAQSHRLAPARRAIATSPLHSGLPGGVGQDDRRLSAAENAQQKKNFLLPVQRAAAVRSRPTALRVT